MHDASVGKRARASWLAPVLAKLADLLAARTPEPPPAVPTAWRGSGPLQRHQEAMAVLTAARAVVARGWVQHAWYTLWTPSGRLRSVGPMSLARLDHRHVVRACLVGAVVHAAWEQSPDPERANPALDALWHTLRDRPGQDRPDGGGPVGPVCSPPVRAARVRDLTRWNDRQGRTSAEVLQLMDRATARVAAAIDRPAPGLAG